MVIEKCKDIENGDSNGIEDLEKPFIENKKVVDSEDDESDLGDQKGSNAMVLLSTAVAVCGSFEFGSCVGYSAPTQSAIREDLNLSLAEYSMFGSILTIGAMIGAISSGRISDFFGRKTAMRLSAAFCITGWLAVYFSMGALLLDVGRFFTGYGIGIFSFVSPSVFHRRSPSIFHCRASLQIKVQQCGLDLFSLDSEWKSLHLVETKRFNVSWYVYTHESRVVLLASGMQCKSFIGYQLTLSKVEGEMGRPWEVVGGKSSGKQSESNQQQQEKGGSSSTSAASTTCLPKGVGTWLALATPTPALDESTHG